MHIARETPLELVVVSGTRWVSAICAVAALFTTLYVVIARNEAKGLFAVAFFLLFAVIMDSRKVFTFDAVQRVARWKGRRGFKTESGDVSFDEITDIGTETRTAGSRNVLVYRLTVVTPGAVIAMAYVYSGQSDGYAALRERILEFVRAGSAVR
jgi:hypothetical protein